MTFVERPGESGDQANPGGANQEDHQAVGFGSLLLSTLLEFEHVIGEPVIDLSVRIYLPVIIRQPDANIGKRCSPLHDVL